MKLKNKYQPNTLILQNIPKTIDNVHELLNGLEIPAKAVHDFGRRRVLITYEQAEVEKALQVLEEWSKANKYCKVLRFVCQTPPSAESQHQLQSSLAPPLPPPAQASNGRGKKLTKAVQTKTSTRTPSPIQINKYVRKLYAIDGSLDFDQPPPPYLKYSYPPVNTDILDAICLTLLGNSHFYTQVLHLMNRMNLEPPFDKRQYAYPLRKEVAVQTDRQRCKTIKQLKKEESDSSESELETSGEDVKTKNLSHSALKRKLPIKEDDLLYKKKAKRILKALHKQKQKQKQQDVLKLPSKKIRNQAQIFRRSLIQRNKIEVKLKSTPPQLLPSELLLLPPPPPPPPLSSSQQSSLQKDLNIVVNKEHLSVFRNYVKGTASNKLYIKNLHKSVTDDDLRTLYASYVSSPDELDIKVMQHGRMKGQAFVTFLNKTNRTNWASDIEQALQNTNGYLLKEKPMVVCYGKKAATTLTALQT